MNRARGYLMNCVKHGIFTAFTNTIHMIISHSLTLANCLFHWEWQMVYRTPHRNHHICNPQNVIEMTFIILWIMGKIRTTTILFLIGKLEHFFHCSFFLLFIPILKKCLFLSFFHFIFPVFTRSTFHFRLFISISSNFVEFSMNSSDFSQRFKFCFISSYNYILDAFYFNSIKQNRNFIIAMLPHKNNKWHRVCKR